MAFPKGVKRPKETREKMSVAKRGKKRLPFSKEWREKIGKARIGIKYSLKTMRKFSETKIGKKNSQWKDGRCQNKDYLSWIKNKRNRLKKASEGSHTFGEWELLMRQYGYKCPACGKSEPEIKLTEDHIIPLSKGGSDYIENIQPLCKGCNSKKHTNIIKYDK